MVFGFSLACVAVDIWALGIFVYEMLVGYTPFASDDVTELYAGVLQYAKDGGAAKDGKLSFPWFFNSEAKAVIEALLDPEPLSRPTPKEVMAHAFFAPVDFVQLEGRQVEAPYRPTITHAFDTSNFEDLDEEDEEEDDEEEVAHRRTQSFVSRLPATAQFPGFIYCDGWKGPTDC